MSRSEFGATRSKVPTDSLAEARAGSDRALGQCLENCRDYLLLIANKELPGDVVAKVAPSDLVQETFLEAHRDFSRFAGTTETELLSWLRRILTNNVVDATRQFRYTAKRSVSREWSLDNGETPSVDLDLLVDRGRSPSSQAIGAESGRELTAAICRLRPEFARVIELRNLKRESFAAVGRTMDRTPNAARKLWSRAIRALIKELDPSDESSE